MSDRSDALDVAQGIQSTMSSEELMAKAAPAALRVLRELGGEEFIDMLGLSPYVDPIFEN